MSSKLATWALLSFCAMQTAPQQQEKNEPVRNELNKVEAEQEKPEPTKPAVKPAANPGAAAPEARPTYMLYEFRLIPIQESMLSATKPGMIIELPVTDGASVEKGDVLGQIDDRESQANIKHAKSELTVAKKQAESDAPIQAAVATKRVAEAEHKKSVIINETKSGAINQIELERLRLTMEKADHQITVAQQEFDVAQLNIDVKAAQVEVTELDAELRKIRAPYSGEVVEMKRHVGEWVQAGDPVLHLVQMDRLRVQGLLDLAGTKIESKFKSSKDGQWSSDSSISPYGTPQAPIDPTELIGRDCEVLVQLPKGRTESFKSKVAFISPVQNVGGKIRVWMEIENKKVNGRWLAQPGQMATVKVLLDPPPKPKVDPKAPAAKPEQKPVGGSPGFSVPNKDAK